jgi:dipeptidyl aminopeptidase/acylaminoacyl peptidase
MSGVDAVIEKGFIDENNLFVTGGSGGGILTAWIVGHTNRFKAAVVAKPALNWYSAVLYSDDPGFFYKYWFPGFPWDYAEHYMKRSPISYVKYVKTPTMILSGENDYRAPIAEIEQYYTALKLNKVETAMVRIQESGHGIADKPSNEINKVKYTLGWFDKFKNK